MSNKKAKFTGTIGRTMRDTRYQYDVSEVRPEDAPNVVYILMDDMGFSHLGCYGSNIHTPNLDRLAKEGLRYNNFHTTAVCSATRASLLTGANHHEAGVAGLVEMQTGCTNGIGGLNPEYATLAEILKEYDYSTFCTGKWHLASPKTQAGPYDNWPLQKGFERYYGMLHGEIDQYHPHLVRDNSLLSIDEVEKKTGEKDYHFSKDIVDNAIEFVFTQKNAFPDKPFFLYMAFGAMHTPHHAPKEYIDKYKGQFDDGWDAKREQWFARQKEIGLIPQDAELTDRNELVDAWDDLSADEKKVYARYMEAFAGMLDHTDEQIGRFIDYLEEIGQLDNTVIVFLSDNGASAEGGKMGRFNAFKGQDVIAKTEDIAYALEHYDEIGTELSFNHYPTGWANAGNTPFQWYKIWSHEGGIKDPLIIRYPKLIKDQGGVRGQYHHVSDITPTILDIIGIKKPASIKGVTQKDFSGISMKYSFESAEAEDQKHVQFYETFGNRGIYKDGWKAVVNHTFSNSYAEDVWELYHVAEDYSEKYNVADKYPEKLRELQDEFLIEASRHNVFPMLEKAFHGSVAGCFFAMYPKSNSPEKSVTYKGIYRPFDLPENARVNIDNASHSGTAKIYRADSSVEGVLFASGDRFSGFTFYIKDNKLKYVYNYAREEYYTAESDIDVPVGDVEVKYTFELHEDAQADVTIYINDQKVGSTHVNHLYYMKGFSSTFRADKYTAVSPEYEVPFEFGGDIKEFTIHVDAYTIDFQETLEKVLNQE